MRSLNEYFLGPFIVTDFGSAPLESDKAGVPDKATVDGIIVAADGSITANVITLIVNGADSGSTVTTGSITGDSAISLEFSPKVEVAEGDAIAFETDGGSVGTPSGTIVARMRR